MGDRKIKILAIDDTPDNLISLKALINDSFPEALLFTALNGAKGIELAATEDPDVILLDIVMPGMDGYEVCKILKAYKKFSSIPVVFLTAVKGDKESRIRALECGAEALLAKPIDQSEMIAEVRAMVKIKDANIIKQNENKRLTQLVDEQLHELKLTHTATLNLLEDLRNEVETRKLSEAKLLKSEELYRNLYDNMLNGFAYCKMEYVDGKANDFTYIRVNSAFPKLTGLKDVEGKKFSEIIPGVNNPSPELVEIYGRVASTGIAEIFETYMKPLDIWFSISVYSPEKEYFVAIFDVITERKQKEEALKKIEFILSEGQKIAHLGTFEYAADTQTIFWSAEEFAIYGLDPEGPPPTYDVMLVKNIHPDDGALLRQTFTAAIQSGSVYDLEHRIVRPDGNIRWVYDRAQPYFDQNGKLLRYVGSTLDITERKLVEEKLNITFQNLERSNKDLEQFAHVANHDLQEPLRMISSYTQLLERKYKDKLDQDANDYIRFAVDGAIRMQKLLNDLLEFSKINTQQNTNEQVDSSTLLGQAISNLQQVITGNSALITNDDLPVIKADEVQIVRVFQNLIENAIKFHKKTELPKIHIACKKQNEMYQFSVADNGIGIDKQYHDRVFIVFQRLHSIKDYPGTGIGLAICKRIIERHGGTIWFESVVNEGTTFYFTIPVN